MSEPSDLLMQDIEIALSGLNRIHSGVSETKLSEFATSRDGVQQVIMQLIRIKNEIMDNMIRRDAGHSGGIFRAIVDHWNDLAHPLASLCMKIESQYNQLKEVTKH